MKKLLFEIVEFILKFFAVIFVLLICFFVILFILILASDFEIIKEIGLFNYLK